MKRLGRRTPTDWRHVEKYPLSALRSADQPVAVPGVLGINWYSQFDTPEKVGRIWIIGRGNFGSLRGGHAICLKPPPMIDRMSWVDAYDQGASDECVAYSSDRMMTLLNRKLYLPQWLYDRAQATDEFADTPPEGGTSVRAAMAILQQEGNVTTRAPGPYLSEGIIAYRWATTWDEVRRSLGVPDSANSVPMLQSWGRANYPHVTHLVDEAGERLLAEEGEYAVVVDR